MGSRAGPLCERSRGINAVRISSPDSHWPLVPTFKSPGLNHPTRHGDKSPREPLRQEYTILNREPPDLYIQFKPATNVAETMFSSALDHDFNNTWGAVLGVTETKHRPIASSLMSQYWEDRVKVERSYQKILSQYIDQFEKVYRHI
jgi:hypothetical protein